MKIIKEIMVKQILTEKRKQQLLHQISSQKKQIRKEIDQLEFQLHKKVKNNKNNYEQQANIKKSYSKEIKQRYEKIKILDFQEQQIDELQLGAELKGNPVNAVVEVNVGDNWDEIMNGTEIIINDGIIQEIRKGEGIDHD